jgi:hypothetical protein
VIIKPFTLILIIKSILYPSPQVTTENLGGEKAEPAFAFVNYFKQAIKELETNKNLDYIIYQ